VLPLVLAAIVYAVALSSCPPLPSTGDALSYSRAAERLVRFGVLSAGSATPTAAPVPDAVLTPVYPLVLATVYRLTPATGDAAIRMAQPWVVGLQLLMALATVAAITWCGRIARGEPGGLVAGVLSALYVPFGFASMVALSETLGTLLVAAQLGLALLIVCGADAKRPRTFALLGVVSGLIALTRPAYALWVAVPLAFVLLRQRGLGRIRRDILLFIVGVSLVMVPWVVRNVVSLGEPVVLSTNASKTLLDATGGSEFTAEDEAVYATAEAQGKDALAAVAHARMKRKFLESPTAYVADQFGWINAVVGPGTPENPLAGQPWIAPVCVYWEHLNAPGSDSLRFGASDLGEPSAALRFWTRFSVGYQALLYLLALAAIVFAWRDPKVWLLLSLPLYSIAVHSATLFINRYFFPVMPAVIVLAAVGALEGYRRFTSKP